MIPRTSSGRGFKGAAAYYFHDKGARTSDRVRFTHAWNLSSDNVDQAINEMCWTAMHQADLKAQAGVKATGRKLEKPVYTVSLSWHPSEKPTDEQMREAGLSALKALKMESHQILMVAHRDTDHPHVHLIVNRVNPETGIAHPLKKDQLILSRWAEKYEREHGKTWCIARVKNNAERQSGRINQRGKFVKDKIGQQRDAKPQYDRRAKAIEAKRLARTVQRQAMQSRQAPPKSDSGRKVPVPVLHDHAAEAVRAARAAQRAAREAWELQARQKALDAAARKDKNKGKRELYRASDIVPPHDPKKAEEQFRQQQQQDRKREAFERWQIEQMNAMQDRHITERNDLAKLNEQRYRDAEDRIEQAYGISRRQMEKRLATLREREQRGSGFSRMVDRMKGLEAEREAIEKGLANIVRRIDEILSPLAKEQAISREQLADRQGAEKRNQAEMLERQRQAGYEIPGAARKTENRRGPSRGFGWDFGNGRGMR